ncbi:MAG: bifunctional diaminohydroxyphosphoribosylaminopyrimidine deaminase/5-amino-6-(5-phosphoribosylamino)uracil reductase RibD [Hydrogenophaga sp.]|uniref:bifunctional diaminohydroxyphosphoribosylaminopyrimidine deaminase/5-amino-6-(5-phosphoribosylamino)uracil reductase RibD n=1 Tax=Hydrogenophaga sp. TaxID=1904254 RepID=UPI0016BD52CA|nr:bifunctional diaminohydroxyphosphoribosylaminopyrimidine deaminase/5-amino-6-(5-phosphoribosylamino)uracil reductase RibD [Hydrogenophaga sp.]NIM40756.1 bifunctional diaminohydroxyphosphoribosylaminopyrimidine deaminase/5-amino-6-(5-phosphoribosylamino)uracil reductase RibD [Hydrogenophaga sp.]NIN26231.1 bifunctional diaminohydroxyphosphoribosylaminopyrimidine deaminase/5-amino-6-(5-phosphoribosylamino)uracil reductase RibD [Hydrogenophaga sp.]NIN31096.1 bifunctional diaminohydroxyphosphoribo
MNAHWTKSLFLSERSLLLSNPNPRVGCVLVASGDRVIGEGHTQQAGAPHAEVMALRDARARGESVAGATAYVTLEPCSHFGRTPPCCDALIAAQVSRVVVATTDPNPRVAGQGLERLRAAGVQVDLLPTDHPAAIRSRELNIGFFSRMIRGTPWVRMKVAASLDGITALPNGQSQWITSEAAREDGHRWRARACAVLTGAGTVLEDNPRLDARLPGLVRQPHLAVIDSRLDTPPTARLFEPPHGGLPRNLWFFHADPAESRAKALQQRGAHTIPLPGEKGKVDLGAALRELALREVNELHVEAGAKLNASLLREAWVDELLVYLAPRLLGQGAGMAPLGPLERLADGVALRWLDSQAIGADLRLRARVEGRDAFLTNL